MRTWNRVMGGLLAMLALGWWGLLCQAPAARADDHPLFTVTYFYVEIFGPSDPSLGGNQPLIDSGDSPTPPSYNDIRYGYGDAVTGGGGYTVVQVEEDDNGAIVNMTFHSAGDFP